MAVIIEGIPHKEAKELLEIVANPDDPAIMIDVREPEEYEAGHIPGVPLIPMGDIIDLLEQFDRQREYVFLCRSGRRSLEVAKFFQNNGFPNVYNFAGGMLKWQQEGFEIAEGAGNIVDSALPLDPKQLERKRNK